MTTNDIDSAKEIVDWLYGAKNIDRTIADRQAERQLKEVGEEQKEVWEDWRFWAE